MNILLGYEVGTGKPVKIPLAHLIATGITQLSGKTTTLEALIQRSGLRAVVFKTKIGEAGFSSGAVIPPYFLERADWQYFASLLEATLKERLKFERSWIMRACKGASNLLEVKANIDCFLAEEKKLRAMDRDMFFVLQEYLAMVLPQLQYANFSKTLSLVDGVNIMDLERFKEEVQSLVIRSVLETALKELRDTIIVMPEVWKFLPQGRGNPCKWAAEAFIRQGAANRNYLWLDSQDLAKVDKGPLKQVSCWILGLQQERNEVKHTLDQIPLPRSNKPKEDEIMTLGLGHFFLCTPTFTIKVYVQPAWLDDKTAKDVARGRVGAEEVKRPEKLAPFSIGPVVLAKGENFEAQKLYARFQQDIAQLREDFFNKIQQVQEYATKIGEVVSKIQGKESDVNQIVSLVLQKMPLQKGPAIDEGALINKILQQVPRIAGAVTYEVAPLVAIKKGFLQETKDKLLSAVSSLEPDQKKILKFLETKGAGSNYAEVLERCFFLSPTSGGNRDRVAKACKAMAGLGLVRQDEKGRPYPYLREKIKDSLGFHEATEQEVQQVYDHILVEMLK